jgi:hypothetical protein
MPWPMPHGIDDYIALFFKDDDYIALSFLFPPSKFVFFFHPSFARTIIISTLIAEHIGNEFEKRILHALDHMNIVNVYLNTKYNMEM